jgi:hypothetical protein
MDGRIRRAAYHPVSLTELTKPTYLLTRLRATPTNRRAPPC